LRIRRRAFLGGAISVAALSRAGAQPVTTKKRLAIYSPSEPSALMQEDSENRYYRALFAELRRLGQIVGENLIVEPWGAEKAGAGAPALVDEVVRSAPDVVYVVGPGVLLFKRATDTIPVVALTADPVAIGLATNLARPGGNFTGVSVDTGPSIHGKRIALLREMFPGLSRIGFIGLRGAWEGPQGPAVRAASRETGVEVIPFLVDFPTTDASYQDVIARIRSAGANAVMVGDSPDVMVKRAVIATQIASVALPAIYPLAEFVEVGGLMTYSFDLVELNRRAANNIDAILRGRSPGEIPFYQATKFELALNLKAAAALSLQVPATLLASADRVIE
jgi:putative ABC transport system substrate-binding protein